MMAKTISNQGIMYLIQHCSVVENENHACDYCPLAAECDYYYNGTESGSALESLDGEDE